MIHNDKEDISISICTYFYVNYVFHVQNILIQWCMYKTLNLNVYEGGHILFFMIKVHAKTKLESIWTEDFSVNL